MNVNRALLCASLHVSSLLFGLHVDITGVSAPHAEPGSRPRRIPDE